MPNYALGGGGSACKTLYLKERIVQHQILEDLRLQKKLPV